MDGRGRFAQPLTWLAPWRARLPAFGRAAKLPRVRRGVARQSRVPDNAELPPSRLEQLEKLEQLRALEHGIRIKAVETRYESFEVNTPADLEQVRRLMTAPIS